MYHHHDVNFQVAQLRYQELLKEAEEYQRIKALLPRQPKLTDRLLYHLASMLIALGQALHGGARGSAGVAGLIMLLLSACSGPAAIGDKAGAAPQLAADSTLAAPYITGWQTYSEPVSGVVFEHPPGCLIAEPVLAAKNMSERYTVTLTAIDDELAALAADETQLQLTIVKAPTGTLAEVVAQQRAELVAHEPSLVISAEEL